LHVRAADRVACGACAAAGGRIDAGEQLVEGSSLDGDAGGGIDQKGGEKSGDLHFFWISGLICVFKFYKICFMSAFWYLDWMGVMAESGHKAFCRQTFIGGNYGLLQVDSFLGVVVNPDFYGAVLFKELMIGKIYKRE
jgi:hypothetical protein